MLSNWVITSILQVYKDKMRECQLLKMQIATTLNASQQMLILELIS